jgi:hypothetical protein
MTENSSFSRALPGLQLGIDSTSLGAFKKCPRYYQYTIVEGWQPKELSVHLHFGILLHSALERYDHAKAEGKGHEDARDVMLDWALKETWNSELGRPWISGDNIKNRISLLRTIIWYVEHFGENDSLSTVLLTNGKPAVEVSFRFDTGLVYESTGEKILLCGHIDRIADLNGDHYVSDRKTTKYGLDPRFFSGFTPDNQFSIYTIAGGVALGKKTKGLILDGIQIGVNFTRFARNIVPRPEGVLEEWIKDFGFWARQMETCALEGYWPMNDKGCHMYAGCEFRDICSRSPETRQQWLNSNFTKRVWDPLQVRGDI